MDLQLHRPKLDHVAQVIKRVMLTYPRQFSCRMDVLVAIFSSQPKTAWLTDVRT